MHASSSAAAASFPHELPSHARLVEAGQQRAVDVERVEVAGDLHAQREVGAAALAPALPVGAQVHALQGGQVELREGGEQGDGEAEVHQHKGHRSAQGRRGETANFFLFHGKTSYK